MLYKIEIPANRYDLLSSEGLAIALRSFLSLEPCPTYHLDMEPSLSPNGHVPLPIEEIHVSAEMARVRPYVFAAILKNVSLDAYAYDSFIKMQDKLHQTIARYLHPCDSLGRLISWFSCRNRTLASVGTHDYDSIKGPFKYEGRAPASFDFVPLNQSKSVNGSEIAAFYSKDLKLRSYVDLLTPFPIFPLILDSSDTVCSLPPLINSEHSKISVKSKNIFIEVTATDATKGEMLLKTLLGSFSYYCKKRYS